MDLCSCISVGSTFLSIDVGPPITKCDHFSSPELHVVISRASPAGFAKKVQLPEKPQQCRQTMPMVSMLENQSCFVHFRSCAKVGRCQTQRCLRCLFPKSRPKFLSFTCGLERKTQSNAQHLRSKKCVMLRTPTTGRGQPLANHSKASCTQHSCHHIAPWSWSRKGRAGGPFNDGLVAVRWRCGKSMRLENEKNWNSASGLCFRLRLCL